MVGISRDKPVLVGLSGGLDSMVAAYLLRIQKRELYGVIIAGTPEQFQDEGEALFACHQTESRIAAVKKFCEHLQIPLTIIRPKEDFVEEVMEYWLAARIEARRPRTCHDCHSLRLHLLAEQMKELKCASIATGHYAKLMRNTPGGPVSVHSSNDLAHDQAGLLAGIPQGILSKLELPLSELQHKEVLKIAENFALHPPQRTLKFGQCLPSHPKLNEWVNKHVPESLRVDGEVLQQSNDSVLGRHNGFVNFEYGKVWKEAKGSEKEQMVVGSRMNSKELLVATVEYFKDKAVFLRDCQWGEGTDFSTPMKGFIHHDGGLTDVEVLIVARTLGGAWVQLLEGEETFLLGQELTLYRRRGKNAKVIVTGTMSRLGRQFAANRISIEAKGENGIQTVEVDKDFNF